MIKIRPRGNESIQQMLKRFKRLCQREGLTRDLKRHSYYEKPSEKRAREKAEAIRRARKLARKKAQREGGGGGMAARPRPARP